MALISVIVPIYGVGKYLDKCVQSIVDQTYQKLEIILVDDGSKDGCGRMCDKWADKDKRIRVIHQENSGVSKARFAALSIATGEWIGFVDGDDLIEPDMFERLLTNALENDADISHCGYQKVFPDGEKEYYYASGKKIVQEGGQGCQDLLEGAFVEPGIWNKLYKKQLFEGLFEWLDTSIKYNEDLLMNFYLFRNAKKSVYEDVCLYSYMVRIGSASASRLTENKLKDPLKVLDILDKETKEDAALNLPIRRRLVYLLINGATIKNKEQKELTRPFAKEARKRIKKSLKEILKGDYSKKLKVSALWASVFPASYRWVHQAYVKKKYKKYKEIYPWMF